MLTDSVFSILSGFARLLDTVCGLAVPIFFQQRGSSRKAGNYGEYALEIMQRFTDEKTALLHSALTNCALVITASLLDHRDRLADRTRYLEVPHQDDGVRQIAHLDRLVHGIPEDSMLHQRHDARDAVVGEEAQKLVDLNRKQPLLGHRLHVAVDRIDDHERAFVTLDCADHLASEFTR